MTTNNTYLDATLNNQSAANSHVATAQGKFANGNTGYQKLLDRGSDALSTIIGDLAVSIETMLASTTPAIQALILAMHHVQPAKASASVFGPWIKVFTGRKKPNGKLKKAADGQRYPEWEPNRSFERYHHVMEWLREANVTSNHADAIKKAGGANAIVEARQKQLKSDAEPGKKATAQEQRELLLTEGDVHAFELPFALPKDAGEFFTVVCRRNGNDSPVMLGVVRPDADKDVTALAAIQWEALKKAKADREVEEARGAAAAEAAQEASEQAEQRFMRVMLSPDKLAKMKAEAERRREAGELAGLDEA